MLTYPTATVPARTWNRPAGPRLPHLSTPALLTAIALVATTLAVSTAGSLPQPSPAPLVDLASPAAKLAGLPVRFEANLGQSDSQVRFLARAGATSLFLTPDALVLSVQTATTASTEKAAPRMARPAIVRMGLVGADPTAIEGSGALSGVSNYYLGADRSKWVRSVPSYSEVRYRRLHPGIDLVVHAHTGALEYDYVIAPGADPGAIALDASGARAISLDRFGNLVLGVDGGQVRQERPVAYQDIDGTRRRVDAAFVLEGHRVRFRLGDYDHHKALVIDPTLAYSTFLGGTGEDEGRAVAVDGSDSSYITGWTGSPDFPTGPAQDPNQAQVAFVTKLSPDGSALAYSSYFGGTGGDRGNGIAVHGGSAYVTGTTNSTDFPTTDGAFSRSCGTDGNCTGGSDGFVTSFAPDGSMAYSTYLGGRGEDVANAVAVDNAGAVHLTGTTRSIHFPTTAGALQPVCGADGGCNANATFVDGVSTAGSTMYTSATAAFSGDDVGKEITGTNIPPATTIATVVNAKTITLSQPATASGSKLTFSIANATFTDGASTADSPTYTSTLPHFLPGDVGRIISGDYIPGDTTIVSVDSPTSVTLSANAEGTGTGLTFTIDRHSFTDGVSTIGTPNYTSASASFTDADRNRPFSGDHIPSGTTIAAVVDATTVTLSEAPTASGSGLTFTVDRNTIPDSGRAFSGSTLFFDFQRSFLDTDVGRAISGVNIAPGTTIVAVNNSFTVVLSNPATGDGSGTFRIARDTSNDGVSSSGSTTFTSASANFIADDVGKGISGTNIPAGTTIVAVDGPTAVTLSANATADGTGLTFTIDRHTFHDGVATTDSPPFTSATASFQPTDVGRDISGTNIPGDTKIAAVLSATAVRLTNNATGTGSDLRFTISRGRARGEPRTFAFVTKLTPDGSGLAYSTFLGGNGDTSGAGISLAGADPVVTGSTRAPDFPSKGGAQAALAGGTDAFVTRVAPNSTGSGDLVFATFLGGPTDEAGNGGDDAGNALTVGATGIYVTGSTNSTSFPVQGAFDATCAAACSGGTDAFVTKIAPDGSALLYSTYLGGGADDAARAIAVDGSGSAFVAGVTSSRDFPTAHGLLFSGGETDAFATKLSPSGAFLDYSTYLSGGAWDEANGVALSGAGDAIVTGHTSSPGFVSTPGALDTLCGSDGTCDLFGSRDAFVVKLGNGDYPGVASLDPPGGPVTVATSVLITGGSFTGATAVRFGDVPVIFSVLSDSVIRATSPVRETPGEVAVTVTNPTGTSYVTVAGTFRYGEGLFTPTASCTIFRCGQGATLLPSGKVLAAVGEGGRDAELYDPLTGTWSRTGNCADLPGPGGAQGCAAGFPTMPLTVLSGPPASCGTNCGKVLVSGGYGPGGQQSPNSKAAFLYDPATGSWRRTADMHLPRVNHSSTLLPDGTVLVAGGCQLRVRGCGPSGGSPEVTAELYHPDTETWTLTTDMNAGRAVFPMFLLDAQVGPCGALCGKVLAVGGVSNGAQQEAVEAYDPVAKTWTVQAPLTTPRYANPALQVPDATVVAVGTYGGNADTSEYLDLVGDGGWAPTGAMVLPSDSEGKAVRLPNGKVLAIPGGRGAQLYDGPTHSWTATGPRVWAMDQKIEVLLPAGPASACGNNCGKVLIAGEGQNGALRAELYTPRPAVTAVSPASGLAAGGTTVTISGTGLTTVSSVRLGDVNGTNLVHDPGSPDTKLTVTVPAHAEGAVDVTVFGPAGRSPIAAAAFTYTVAVTAPTAPTTPTTTAPVSGGTTTTPTTAPALTIPALPTGGSGVLPLGEQGYAMAASDGGVFTFGTVPFLGSLGALRLNQPIVAIEHTPSGRGYWLVGADGGVFAFGDARFFGSTGGIHLARPIVGMRTTSTGNGYWLVASDGGVFAFGDARFFGSTGAIRLAGPVVGMERSATGNGYWLVGSDGGIFAFGDARFFGSTGAIRLAQPVVAMARSAGGAGYLLVGSDGGVFAFGDAVFRGSTGATRLNSPIVGLARTSSGAGYWLCARDGGVFAFGNAAFAGSLGGGRLNQPVVGCSSARA